jgi:hypothetical protein
LRDALPSRAHSSAIPRGWQIPSKELIASEPESATRLKVTRISLAAGTDFTDASWKGARGSNPAALYDDPL